MLARTAAISISSVIVDGPAGQQEHLRVSFELDPSKQGVAHELRISTNLTDWDARESNWRLVRIDPLPSGNQRQTWERTAPVGSRAREQVDHRGHVTVLK